MDERERRHYAKLANSTGWNGLKVASLFAGAGGSSLGYRLAGFRVAYANEIDERARDTYGINLSPESSSVIDERSVVDVRGGEILEAAGGDLDVLDRGFRA